MQEIRKLQGPNLKDDSFQHLVKKNKNLRANSLFSNGDSRGSMNPDTSNEPEFSGLDLYS